MINVGVMFQKGTATPNIFIIMREIKVDHKEKLIYSSVYFLYSFYVVLP